MGGLRVELQKKVETRRLELERAFQLAEREGSFERRLGLEIALTRVDDAVERGWGRISELAAEELVHWLETTRGFVSPPEAPARAQNAQKRIH
jgi:hypothetical protein